MKSHKGLIGLAAGVALVAAGAAYAGGEDCKHGKQGVVAAGHQHGHGEGHGAGCPMAKGVSKTAKMTDDGAIVTLEGKNEEAIKQIQAHLEEHKDGAEGCPGCPVGKDGVEVKVSLNDHGGQLTLSGSNPDAVKMIQKWAKEPAGSCCAGKEQKS